MIAATGVSRTVIREAVAALRADKLVVSRQGIGAFVAEQVRRPFRVDFDESSSLRDVLNVMELRTGAEVEAAGLAAERAIPGADQKDRRALHAIQSRHRTRRNAVDQDFAFHCEIADATGNPQFRAFSNISAASSFRARPFGAHGAAAQAQPISTVVPARAQARSC